jgi:hypothetical protein
MMSNRFSWDSRRLGTINNVAVATTSTAVASSAFGTQTYEIRVAPVSACTIVVATPLTASTTDATATATSAYVPPNTVHYIKVNPGQKASIWSATIQTVSVVEVTG